MSIVSCRLCKPVRFSSSSWTSDGGRAITIQSENGPENCVIDCEDDGRGFAPAGLSGVLDGLTITRGSASFGAALFPSGASPMILNCVFSNNHAVEEGGAIAVNNATTHPVFVNCQLEGNTANKGGALHISSTSALTFIGWALPDFLHSWLSSLLRS